jgi:hypothetical protein
LVHSTWGRFLGSVGGDIIDWWIFTRVRLQQYLQGWNRNLGHDRKQEEAALLAQISSLDLQGDSAGLEEHSWALRYHLEDELMQLYRLEEEYWR